jgi:hypothetical protein
MTKAEEDTTPGWTDVSALVSDVIMYTGFSHFLRFTGYTVLAMQTAD